MATLGSLVVSLEANMAKFQSDMGRAAQLTERAMGTIQGAADMARNALAALGVGASAAGIAALIKGSIDAADNLRDMSQKTGIAVETLNGLGFAAGQAGGSLESMVAAAGKLNKTIVEAAGGNKDVGEAFSKLGISVRDAGGNLKKADVIMAEVADKFKTFADGPEKTAIALRIFGKAGADMIPVLNDGGDAMRENIEYAKKYSGMTQELSDAADNFNDSMGRLAIQQKGFSNAMATAVLPLLQLITNELLDASEQSNKYALATEIVRTTLETFVVVGSEVAFTFSQIGTGIGGAIARLDALRQGDFKGFSVIGDMMEADLANAKTKHDAFIANVLDRTPRAAQSVTDGWDDGGPKKAAPMLRAKGDDPTKAILDGRLKAIEAAFASERDTAAFQSQFIGELYKQDMVDLTAYQDFKREAIERGLATAVRAYDEEISILEKYRAAAAKDTERTEATNKINEKTALKEKARADASRALSLNALSLSASQSDLNKIMKEWGIQQDHSISQMQFSNDLYGKSALEVAKLTEARRIELDIEEKIRLAKEKGAITDESIAKFRADGKVRGDAAGKVMTQAAGMQIGRDQLNPQDAQREAERVAHEGIISDLQAFQALKLENVIAGNAMIEEENARHERAKASIQIQFSQQAVGMAGDSASQLYSIMQQAGLEQTALGKALFIANKAIAIAEIIMNTEVAAAKALAMGPIIGPPLAMAIRVMGYASAGIVLGTTIASAEGGYDIPAGKNPVTQLHEKEMVLPKAQADVIRGLAAAGGKGGAGGVNVTYAPVIQIDSRSDQAQVRQMVVGAVKQGNADLVDRLSRAGRI